jgi:transposase
MDVRFCERRNHGREAQLRAAGSGMNILARSSKARLRRILFSLDNRLTWRCGDEKSSADKVLRTPLSKQRNKHIQRVLVEAAKLAPKHSHELALVYEKAKEKGNANRATIAVARKMVSYLVAVDRGQRPFVPAEDFSTAVA